MKFFSKKSLSAGRKGFTLIELLAVIAIIGILASIVMVSLTSARAKARDAKRVADIRTLQLALEEYYNDNNHYPASLMALTPTYISVLPTDPNKTGGCANFSDSACYAYNAFSTYAQNCATPATVQYVFRYHLGASMESDSSSNASLFSQAAKWTPPADGSPCTSTNYCACTSSGNSARFTGLSSGSNGCSSTVGTSPYDCYDQTN